VEEIVEKKDKKAGQMEGKDEEIRNRSMTGRRKIGYTRRRRRTRKAGR